TTANYGPSRVASSVIVRFHVPVPLAGIDPQDHLMRLLAKLCLVTLVAGAAGAAPRAGDAQTVSALRAQLDQAGNRLEHAAEAYNEARLKRSHLDGRLAHARTDVSRSQARLNTARGKLGVAVRNLYMHPA